VAKHLTARRPNLISRRIPLASPALRLFGPGNLASIHITASLSTDTLLENINANLEASAYGDTMLTKDSLVSAPTGPGLGVEPDMAVVAKYRQGPAVTVPAH
jgi:D-galactarolactone cycloisomerase